jgi:hypothetical protein
MVNKSLNNNYGDIHSMSAGALIPLGLHWRFWDAGKNEMINDLTVSTSECNYLDEKTIEIELDFKGTEIKEVESAKSGQKSNNPMIQFQKYTVLTKKVQEEQVRKRNCNRWGDGLEDPSSGVKEFFPSAWKPTKELDQSLIVMGLTKKEVEDVLLHGAQHQQMAKQIDILVSPGAAAAVYAYTMETPNIYAKLNAACRSTGRRAKLQLGIYRDYLYHIFKASNTMPNFVGRSYRGIDVRLSPKKCPVGEVITWQQMSSTTKKMTATLQFLGRSINGGLEGTLFVVDVNAGKEIDLFSAFPNEDEVLLELNSHFLVAGKIEGKQNKCEVLEDLAAYNMEQLEVYLLKQR